MRRLLLLSALASLVACGNHDAQPADTASVVMPPSADSARVADSLKRAGDTVKPTASATVVLPEHQLYSFTSRASTALAVQQRAVVAAPVQPGHSHKRIWGTGVVVLLAAGAGWAYVRRKHRHADTASYSRGGGSDFSGGGASGSPRNQEQ